MKLTKKVEKPSIFEYFPINTIYDSHVKVSGQQNSHAREKLPQQGKLLSHHFLQTWWAKQ